jgi:hypothetical protein
MLYAAGFKLGRNGFSIERTGMFIIDSRPRGAKIFINGQAQKTLISTLFKKNDFITTPAKIKNILPGEYELAVELNGYWSWRKKLIINPGASTFAEDIYLFKNSLPTQIKSAKIDSMVLSPDKNKFLISAEGQLNIINLTDETEKLLSGQGLKNNNIFWSNDSQKIVINNYLYSLNDLNKGVDLNTITAGSYNFEWSNNFLFYRDKTSIFRLGDNNLPKKIINNQEFSNYLIKDGYLYLIKQAKQTVNLEIIELATTKILRNINLPASTDYSFINPEQALLNLYDKSHNILYLIDPVTTYYSPLREIINNVKTAIWINDNDLLYTNDYEIWLYNLVTKNKTLVTRISEPISGAVILQNKNYIIYSTGQTINTIELDERQKRNITELVKFDTIDWLSLGSGGDTIYFFGKIGNSAGLYKLSIQ